MLKYAQPQIIYILVWPDCQGRFFGLTVVWRFLRTVGSRSINMDHPGRLPGDDGGNKCRDEPWRQSHHPRELGMGYRPFSDSLLLQDLPLIDSSSNFGNFVSSNSKTPMSDLGMSITGNNHFTNGSNRSQALTGATKTTCTNKCRLI